MGSAVNSVLGGGGGGGLLGMVGGIVGGIFGGPIGAMIGQAIGNMVQSAVGDATKQAVDTLQKEHGMPKFLAEQVKSKISEVIDGLTDKSVDADTQAEVNESTRGPRDEFVQDLADSIVEKTLAKMRQDGLENSDETRSQAKSGAGKKGGSTSWLEAIAKAMGEALGQKAAKMVDLSNQIATSAGKDGKDAAAANAKATTEMQATSQMFSLMQNGFASAIKGIGEALSQMARKG